MARRPSRHKKSEGPAQPGAITDPLAGDNGIDEYISVDLLHCFDTLSTYVTADELVSLRLGIRS